MKWNYFIGACFLMSVLMLQAGAPMAAVIGGISIAGLLNWRNQRKSLLKAPRKQAARH